MGYDLALDGLIGILRALDLGWLPGLIVPVLARNRPSELADALAHRAPKLRQALRPEDHQGDDEDDDQLEWSNVRHPEGWYCGAAPRTELGAAAGRRRAGWPRCPASAGDTLPRVILSDKTIRAELESGGIVIEPLTDDAIQPSSVDLHVDRFFRVFRNDTTPFIDPKQPQDDLTEFVEVDEGKAFILHPGEFVLGSTRERVALGDDLVARLEGKSSLGRLGLLIHSTAGFVDAGWDGHLTLELSNVANLPIAIYPDMKIGQISFLRMSSPAEHPYGSDTTKSKYQGQRGPTPSRYYMNFREDEQE